MAVEWFVLFRALPSQRCPTCEYVGQGTSQRATWGIFRQANSSITVLCLFCLIDFPNIMWRVAFLFSYAFSVLKGCENWLCSFEPYQLLNKCSIGVCEQKTTVDSRAICASTCILRRKTQIVLSCFVHRRPFCSLTPVYTLLRRHCD